LHRPVDGVSVGALILLQQVIAMQKVCDAHERCETSFFTKPLSGDRCGRPTRHGSTRACADAHHLTGKMDSPRIEASLSHPAP
jgi:hypothetical protein